MPLMNKTTVYLPDDLKAALARAAATSGRSEADLIREGVRLVTLGADRPRPRGALFHSGDGTLSQRVDELLAGFGER
jgi:plasmid stability protein